jgi:radical SAM protein with 4Fe4S-binding SPASM domain
MIRAVRLHVAVAEVTLACPCRCVACGSDAGRARPDELDLGEWRVVFRDLAALGTERLTLSGGEPFARADWPAIVRAAVRTGPMVDAITSGWTLDAAAIREIRRAGLCAVTISIDGPAEVHDRLRGLDGAHRRAIAAIRRLDAAGMRVGVATQVNRWNLRLLAAVAREIQAAGAYAWQLQLTMPAGRAAAAADLVLGPEEMGDVHATIRRLQRRRGLRPFVTDNVGYLTADDVALRTPARTPPRCWMGCFAGLRAVAITSDGGVKGCLSLPDDLREGNVRVEPLARIWGDPERFAYNRRFDRSSLWGACATCEAAEPCRGGCTAMAIAAHGRPGRSDRCFRLTVRAAGLPEERETSPSG